MQIVQQTAPTHCHGRSCTHSARTVSTTPVAFPATNALGCWKDFKYSRLLLSACDTVYVTGPTASMRVHPCGWG